MSETIVIGLLTLLGTLIGTFGGIVTSSKLLNYRISELEKKVEKHNSIVERTYILEGKVTEMQHEIKDLKAEG